MRERHEAEAQRARLAAIQGEAYSAIELPQELGMECPGYKWRQNQSQVEIFIPLPEGTAHRHLQVTLTTSTIAVTVHERPVLRGKLFREIKAEESTWYIQDGVLEMILLKRNRKGHYERGTTNADTFWRSIVQSAPDTESLPLYYPPTSYYWSYCEDAVKEPPVRRIQGRQDQALQAITAA